MSTQPMLTLQDLITLRISDAHTFSDLHKDVYGFRPRGVTFASVEAFEAEYTRLVELLSDVVKNEQKEAADALVNYNLRITGIMADFNVDHETAIRWDMQAFDVNTSDTQDVEHYFWKQLLSYSEIIARTSQFVAKKY